MHQILWFLFKKKKGLISLLVAKIEAKEDKDTQIHFFKNQEPELTIHACYICYVLRKSYGDCWSVQPSNENN